MIRRSNADSILLFRPKVAPDPRVMETLKKKIESFSYIPAEGFHRDKVQPRRVPLAPYSPPPWLFAEVGGEDSLYG